MRMYRNDTNNGTADVDLGNQEPGSVPGLQTQLERDSLLQRKPELQMGQVGDSYEVEADRVADTVLAGGSAGAISSVHSSVQRAGGTHGADLGMVQNALSSSVGGSMAPGVQSAMESSFGRSFSDVQIHTDGVSAQAAKSIGAAAFTVGQDIYFGAGQYAPETAQGTHLLAHELTHTVQQGNVDAVQCKLIQADPEAPGAPAPSGAPAAPAMVSTMWNINFENTFSGTGKTVEARTGDTSLYVKQFKVAPQGDAGKPAPSPKIFTGITLAKSGSAAMGQYDHPKDKGGKASANVAYGKRPTFNFSLKTTSVIDKKDKDQKDEAAKVKALNNPGKAHDEVVNELTSALDDFVDQAEAQAKLQEIVNKKFQHVAVEAKVTLKESAKEAINTTDLNYGSVASDKTFNIKVTIPQAKGTKNVVSNTSENNEASGSKEVTKEKGSEASKEKETKTLNKQETEFVSSIESGMDRTIEALHEKINTSLNLDENTVTTEKTFSATNSTDLKLSGDISGEAGVSLKDIPLLGDLIGDLASAKLNIKLTPDFKNSTTFGYSSKDTEAQKKLKSEEAKLRSQYAAKMTSTWKSSLKSSIKQTVENSVTEKTGEKKSEKEGTKESEGGKKTSSKNTTVTTGTLTIVADTVQPVLTEE